MLFFKTIVVTLTFAHAVLAALYTDAFQLPTLSYDFVVIGDMYWMFCSGNTIMMLVCSWCSR